jgi:hypothetical protein
LVAVFLCCNSLSLTSREGEFLALVVAFMLKNIVESQSYETQTVIPNILETFLKKI